ncbi:serine hydrolase domain-containing protein [Flavobacterium sp. HJJ]|uniref:serine hydrolase domain-containing protein n=1 Tax=Flavobacterium sp. HJJ TaxID=2783792 RepID=UPI00188CE97B|nr:serine hydrolase domain-containing protein [Flavobacterium sp. HJJ]MBF4469849.1 beta-lactamase family protein [Flavobacterium sp. HJJ]
MKSKIFIAVILLVFPVILFGQTIKRVDGSKLTADSLNTKIEHLMKTANVSGVAISVFNDNKLIFSKTFGLADVQKNIPLQQSSIMYGASFAKSVFAYIAMQYVQEGVINLDKPLVEYLSKPLPDYKINGFRRGYQDLKEDLRYKKLTARMCLAHTTGFPNWRWFEADKKIKFKFDPGTRYSYSGEGLYLLQFVLEQITGKDYETISQERVFKPLGMANTSQIWQARFDENICYGHNAKGEPYELMKWKEASAGGSMSTSLEDYTKFYATLISGKGLSKESFKEMTNQQIRIRSRSQFGPLAKIDSTDNDNIQLGYGLGVGTFKTPYGRAFFKEGHDEGWGHYSIAFPDRKIAVVIMTNNDNGESLFKELLEYSIGDKFTPWRWENYTPYNYIPLPVVNIFQVTTQDLDKYLGTYASAQLPIKIAITKNNVNLIAQATGQQSFALQATEKDKFSYTDEGIILEFNAADSSMLLKQSGQIFNFAKE